MKKLRHIVVPFLCLLAMLGCDKKPYPESVVKNSAVFYFDGMVNGERTLIEAGRGDYYMYSSHDHEADSIVRFKGVLQQNGCSGCGNYFEVVINNSQLTATGEPMLNDSTFRAGNRDFVSPSPGYYLSLRSHFNKQALSYVWDFGDGGFAYDPEVSHYYSRPGQYNICLKITSPEGCQSTLCNSQQLQTPGLRSQITAINDTGNTIFFSQSTSGKAPFSFLWDFGDGTTSTQLALKHTYKVPGSYPVVLRVRDADGNVVTTHYNAVTSRDSSSCAANYEIVSFVSQGVRPLSQITVRWRDAHGVLYSSDNIAQQGATFRVVNVEDYDQNEKGEPTKKITLQFSCVLGSGTSTISIQDAEAVIAVSYR